MDWLGGNALTASSARLPPSHSLPSPAGCRRIMGLNSSKLSRSTVSAVAQKHARTPPTNSAPAGVSFSKTNEIRQDGFDPHLGQMLNKLGPVQVPKLSTSFHPKDNMLKILENRGIDSSNSSPEHDLTSPTTSHPSETREAARLELTTIIEMIRRHHINQGSIHPSFSNLDKEDEAHLDGLVKTIDPDTYQYLIRHFHPIDNIKLVKNPNPNQVDQPIKMACRFSGFSYYCSSWRT
ncbi:hypothetical protein PCANC_09068 [Puccinia coronata f. sp. avenae]|uniref:Uncharacterized protein n=1 Tax=Puccinia coronata f. sp. avenae TaxID=200324 RepID=A0A2N5TGX7_9BASI|nr:hypothetical protein PCANC_09068 [Puccinia coronata f. sp. avenae]PLW24743.1 hypothetical protein PCASD_05196 [Puccinia coronata f. sp. avenae]